MRCDLCNQSEPTTYVELQHNVGMLIMRRVYTTQGELCRRCLSKRFWHHTLSNLTLGWWGTISFFMTWYFLVSNTFTYVRAQGELGREGARKVEPVRSIAAGEDARRILERFEHNVRLRLRTGETPEEVARDLARFHGVELADAQRFVTQVREAA